MKKFLLAIVFLLSFLVLLDNRVFAQEETLEARVEKILEEKQIKPMGSTEIQLYQKLELLVTKGSLKDKRITIENGNIPVANNLKYKVNDRVIVTFSEVINYEIIADEVVRTLVGSIGLILAVPVTTFITALVAEQRD